MEFEFWAPCPAGIERVLAYELKAMGAERIRPLTNGVSFAGPLEMGYRACLWSRTASRVLLVIDRVPASNAQELYESVFALPWEDHIDPRGTIHIHSRGGNENLHNSQFTSQKVKDAVCDKLRRNGGFRPSVDVLHPDVSLDVIIHETLATICIDLAGESLHRRPWRAANKAHSSASMRDALCAATLYLCGWEEAAQGKPLVDPMCGSASFPIEAAMIAGDIAPGRYRAAWGFDKWLGHDPATWKRLLDEADARAADGVERVPPIYASDNVARAVKDAAAAIRRAGVSQHITLTREDATLLKRPDAPCGLMAFEPPFGDMALSQAQLPVMTQALVSNLHHEFNGYKLALITPDEHLRGALKIQDEPSWTFYNGRTPCPVYMLEEIPPASEAEVVLQVAGRDVTVGDARAEQFARRLEKMTAERAKWAEKAGVGSYRIYDADLPDYNLSVDLYAGAGRDEGRRWAHVCEYAAPKYIDAGKTAQRLNDALAIVPAVLDIAPTDVFLKRRERSKGGSQYAQDEFDSQEFGRKAKKPQRFVIEEDYLKFEVDFTSRLDCGIFLDTRPVRELVFEKAEGARFLNLFGYTGTATVHAAAGGAYGTTTVDLSNTYLDWAQDNMERNGFYGDEHEYICDDCIAWIDDMRRTAYRWDLIYCDPPTFSNSKKMGWRTFDVQRDHAELLIGMSRLLTRDGTGIFVCNLRNFKPDIEKLEGAGVLLEDITAQTIPEDFSRTPGVHHCYLVRRTTVPGFDPIV